MIKKAFLILDKNSLSYFDELNGLKLELPKDTVSDLEVIDKGKLFETITSFIKNNKLVPNKMLMVLNAPLFFEKTFKDQAYSETQTKDFLENVPFENISSKLITDRKEARLMATNKDFYMPIKNIFENEGFKINLVLPYFALEKNNLEIGKKIDDKKAKEFNQKLKLLEQDNLMTEVAKPKPKPKKEKKRFSLLLAVFFILILVLISLLLVKQPFSKPKTEPVQVKEVAILSPTPTPEKITAVEKTTENTIIKIIYNSQGLKTANLFKNQLSQLGFKNISVVSENSPSNTSKTFAVFSLKFPETLKEKIITRVNKTFIDVIVQENNLVDTDVLITIGQVN